MMNSKSFFCAAFLLAAPWASNAAFTPIFDGKTLNGWKLLDQNGPGYGITNGVLYCKPGGGGKLLTEKEYGDFALRFEFLLESGSNNGIGIRTETEGDAAYVGMEIQVLDDTTKKYGELRPEQMHGSIYGVVPANQRAQKPLGQWNKEEIIAKGRKIKVVLNGKTIVDADLNTITNPEILQSHPGLLRDKGHIGFLGHTEFAAFRNIQIEEFPTKEKDNTPPPGFKALFNGNDLKGWKGLLKDPNDNPSKRAQLTPEALAQAQAEADDSMQAHWKAEDGALVFDGKGRSLCTVKDYADFEMLVDWKIKAKGDSGIYLRGSPQVQIWDPALRKIGSGGIFNNKDNPSNPTKTADKPIGEWNRFRILMTGEKVTVFLNDQLVVHNVTMENYWEREKPIYPTGQLELQNHGNTLWFKNVYVREIAK